MGRAAAQGEVVTIFVGPEKKRYNIHKDIICHHSEYFRAAYNGRWKEADEGVTLEDVEVEVFNIFVHWLYTQQLPSGDLADIAYANNIEKYPNADYLYGGGQLRACAFANRFLVAELERIAHNNYIDFVWYTTAPRYEDVYFVYENLPGHTLIQDLLVKLQYEWWHPGQDSPQEEATRLDLPKEFLVGFMLRHAEVRAKDGGTDWDDEKEEFYMQKRTEKVSE